MKSTSFWSVALTTAVAAAMLIWFALSLSGTSSESAESGRLAAENAVKRGALTCYALEGAYPPSYAYIKKYYGIAVDEKKYIIHYNIFAANIMPDIAVIARGGGGS